MSSAVRIGWPLVHDHIQQPFDLSHRYVKGFYIYIPFYFIRGEILRHVWKLRQCVYTLWPDTSCYCYWQQLVTPQPVSRPIIRLHGISLGNSPYILVQVARTELLLMVLSSLHMQSCILVQVAQTELLLRVVSSLRMQSHHHTFTWGDSFDEVAYVLI